MAKFKINSNVKVKTNNNGVGPGDAVVVNSNPAPGLVQVRMTSGTHLGGTYNVGTMFVTGKIQTKKELQEEAKELEAELSSVNDRINWMEEVKSEEYDEDEFKAWRALTAIESSASKLEKVKILAKLLKE